MMALAPKYHVIIIIIIIKEKVKNRNGEVSKFCFEEDEKSIFCYV